MQRLVRLAVLTLAAGLLAAVAPAPSVAVSRTTAVAAQSVAVDAAPGAPDTVALDRPAQHVAAYWRGRPGARVRLAFSLDGRTFTRPVPAGRDEVGEHRGNGITYGALVDAGGAVAVRVLTDRPVRGLRVVGLGDGETRTRVTLAGSTRSAAATAPQPAVLSRADWQADPQYMTWQPQFYATRKLIVHHTATSDDYTDAAAAAAQIRSIYYYHSVTQGWGDIGYNFLIDKFGNVYEGRYSRDYAGATPSGDDPAGNGVTGAHTGGWNSGTVGVAMLGTYTDKDVTPAARDALEALLAWEADRHAIDPRATSTFVNPVSGATTTTPNIAGHRDYAATECPGGAFYASLPALRDAVATRLTAPTADTSPPTTPTTLTATAGRARVDLAWSASSDDRGVTGYEVWRRKGTSGSFSRVATVSGTSFADGGLARRTTYYYRVRATDAAGNLSAYTPTVSARTT